MQRKTHATNKQIKPRRQVRFPGIVTDAEILGVHRATLHRVLTGEWGQLKNLRKRYDSLKEKQAKEKAEAAR